MPRVSVCIPVYNGEAHIAHAISSVLEQTMGDFELVVFDNASTDATLEVVQSFSDPRLRMVRSDTNIGAGANWNRCLDQARSDVVKILCADDVLLPEALERQAVELEDSANIGVVLVCSRRYIIDEFGKRKMTRGMRGAGRVSGHIAVRRIIRSGANPVGETSSVLLRRSAAIAAGRFRIDSPYVVDVDLWVRMLQRGDLFVVPSVLSEYRVSGGSWSVGVVHKQAEDYHDMVRAVRADAAGGVSSLDAAVGAARGLLNAQLRRVFYALFVRPVRDVS